MANKLKWHRDEHGESLLDREEDVVLEISGAPDERILGVPHRVAWDRDEAPELARRIQAWAETGSLRIEGDEEVGR